MVANPPAWLVELQSQPIIPMFQLAITPPAPGLPNRYQVVELPEVKAPYPMLHDLTDESFLALRERLKVETALGRACQPGKCVRSNLRSG